MSSLFVSRGACMRFRSKKLSDSTSNVWPVMLDTRFQCLSCIALLVNISSSGHVSLKSSIVLRRSSYACHSFRAFGSFRHLTYKHDVNAQCRNSCMFSFYAIILGLYIFQFSRHFLSKIYLMFLYKNTVVHEGAYTLFAPCKYCYSWFFS